MMVRVPQILLMFAALGLLAVGGCQEDSFTAQQARLVIKPYSGTGAEAYKGDRTDTINDQQVVVIDIGGVPLHAAKKATFELLNDSSMELSIRSIVFTNNQTGGEWVEPQYQPFDTDLPSQRVIPPKQSRLLHVTFRPNNVGKAMTEIEVRSNAGNGRQFARVEAEGTFQNGVPNIELRLQADNEAAAVSLREQDCDANLNDGLDDNNDGVIDGCLLPTPLEVGAVGLGGQNTAKLFIVNASTCDPFPGGEPCSTCVITLDRDVRRQNLGVDFKTGTNTDGRFKIQGSTKVPANITQKDNTCDQPNSVPLTLLFTAPDAAGTFETRLVIESNDPDSPLIEIPIKAQALNSPVAVATFRAFDPDNSTAPWTDPAHIDPLQRVYFDGRAKGTTASTHDPRDPTNKDLIIDYKWEVIDFPTDADPLINTQAYEFAGQGTGLFSMVVPLPGQYTVRLTVANTDNLKSIDTPATRVSFEAIPTDRIHIQLVWDDPSNDQDLHLVKALIDDRVCNGTWDCYYSNKTPIWFDAFGRSEGPNPSLDRDDTNGLGPENINIAAPEPGIYRIFVHYYPNGTSGDGDVPTTNTVRIWLNSVQVAEYTRTLPSQDWVWAVADITWNVNGTGTVTPYPADDPGVIGATAVMNDCASPGWHFP